MERLGKLEKEIKKLKRTENWDSESKIKEQWYFGKDGFWRWIIEKVLHKKWLRNPSYAMHYYLKLSEDEKKKLLEQWGNEVKDHIDELKRKGLLY